MFGFRARDEQRPVVIEHRERNRLRQLVARASEKWLRQLRELIASRSNPSQPAKTCQRAKFPPRMLDVTEFGQRHETAASGGARRARHSRSVGDAHDGMGGKRLDNRKPLGEAAHSFGLARGPFVVLRHRLTLDRYLETVKSVRITVICSINEHFRFRKSTHPTGRGD